MKKKKHYMIIAGFLLLCCFGLFSANAGQNFSKASIERTRSVSPVEWNTIKGLRNGTQFESNGLWVIVEETTTAVTANVFTKHGLRDGYNLQVDYWAYTFDKNTGAVVLDGLNSIMIENYFKGTNVGMGIKYLPPVEIFNIYTDEEANVNGLEPFRDGHIGIIFGEETGYKVPWGRGFVTFGANNPS